MFEWWAIDKAGNISNRGAFIGEGFESAQPDHPPANVLEIDAGGVVNQPVTLPFLALSLLLIIAGVAVVFSRKVST